VLDLMIHDIDIALSLARSEVVEVRAIGTPVFGPHEDMAQARLEFASGCVANLTASRTSYISQRTLQAVTPTGHVALDLGNRKAKAVQISERVARGELNVQQATPEEIASVKERLFVDYLPLTELAVPESNAIADEQTDFVTAVRTGRDAIVTGEQGRAALAVAYRILDAIGTQQQHNTRRDGASGVRAPHFALAAQALAGVTRKAG
jgi:predicted dehydrogenase